MNTCPTCKGDNIVYTHEESDIMKCLQCGATFREGSGQVKEDDVEKTCDAIELGIKPRKLSPEVSKKDTCPYDGRVNNKTMQCFAPPEWNCAVFTCSFRNGFHEVSKEEK